MQWNTKMALVLAVFAVFDVLIPIPLMVLFLIFVLLTRPPYFKAWVDRLYAESPSS